MTFQTLVLRKPNGSIGLVAKVTNVFKTEKQKKNNQSGQLR